VAILSNRHREPNGLALQLLDGEIKDGQTVKVDAKGVELVIKT
jgi:hypothetical protein